MRRKLLCMLTIFSIMILLGSAHALQFPSELDVDIAPTEFISSTITLINNDTIEVNVDIDKQGMAVNWVLLSISDFEIDAGDSYQLPIYFTIPDGTAEGTYSGRLKYTVNVNGSDQIYYTDIEFDVTRMRHKIWDDFIYIGEKVTFGDFELIPVDVSLTGHSCWIHFKEGGELTYDGTIDSGSKTLATGVNAYLTDSLVMTSGSKACRIVLTTDQEYTPSKSGTQQGIPDDSISSTDVLNIQGTFEQGRTIIFETSSNGALLAGRILIVSQVNDPLYIDTDGLAMWRVPYNETGAIILKFYMGSNLIDYKSIILGSEVEPIPDDGSGQGQQTGEPEPPKLISLATPIIRPDTPLQIEVRNEWGTRIAGVWVKITKPDGSFLSDDTMTDGVIQFNPPYEGWEEGTYHIRVSKTGYATSPESISSVKVERPRSDIYLRLVKNESVITTGYTNQPVTIEVVDTQTGQLIDLDGIYNVNIGDKTIITEFTDGRADITPTTNGTMSISIPQTSDYQPTSGSWSITGSAIFGGTARPINTTFIGMVFISVVAIVGLLFFIRFVRGRGKKGKTRDRVGFTTASPSPIKVVEQV